MNGPPSTDRFCNVTFGLVLWIGAIWVPASEMTPHRIVAPGPDGLPWPCPSSVTPDGGVQLHPYVPDGRTRTPPCDGRFAAEFANAVVLSVTPASLTSPVA